MKHPATEEKEIKPFIESLNLEESTILVFDELRINQQYSQINVLRKILKDDVLDLSLKDQLQSILVERTGLLRVSLNYLYMRTASMSDQIERFRRFNSMPCCD